MPEQENKTKIVTLRYRPSELKELDAQAEAVNLSRSAYITKKMQGLPVLPAKVPEINWQAYRELCVIAHQLPALGNNINQIAKAMNTATVKGETVPENLPSTNKLRKTILQIEELKKWLAEASLQLLGTDEQNN